MRDIIKPGRRSMNLSPVFKCAKCECVFRADGSDITVEGPMNEFEDGSAYNYDYTATCPWCNDVVTRCVWDRDSIYQLDEEDD